MKDGKKAVREGFRAAVFKRSARGTGKPRCQLCGASTVRLDAHHIISRDEMPNGGYVLSNGIALCDTVEGCHWKAEHHPEIPMYSPTALFTIIGSSEAKARSDAARKG